MKKSFKKIVCSALLIVTTVCFLGCGQSAQQKKAIDTYNEVTKSFNEVANMINENADMIDDDLFNVFLQFSEQLSECKTIVESDDIPDDKLETLTQNLEDIKAWLVDAKAEVEAQIAGE